MKKYGILNINKTSLIILLLAFSFIGRSQSGEFGLRFMPSFSAFDFKSSTGGSITGEVRFSLGFGALLAVNFTEHVGLQGEIIYSSLSQKYKEVDREHNITLRYINIPLLLSLNTGKSEAVNFNLVVGPQIGINVGSKLLSTGGDGTNPTTPVLSVKKGDLGFAYGAGIDFGISADNSLRLGLGFRGVIGLIDISDNSSNIVTNSYYILDRTHLKSYAGYIGVSFLF
ncbi:MAG: PorT family protein [Saprospiraceae bacterium]|nr:PorT family protein [Saprospiraceae bacterium]